LPGGATNRFVETRLSKSINCIPKRTDSRQHQSARTPHRIGPVTDSRLYADALKRALDAPDVADTIVDDSGH
jgi:hypothetical protein